MPEASSPSFEEIRYKKRAVADQKWIVALLEQSPIVSIAMVEGNQPYIVTRTFVYDDERKAIFFHGAKQGRTYSILKSEPLVCLTVTEVGRLLPAKQASKFDIEYRSVVAFGKAHLITEPDQASQALQKLLDKLFPHLKPSRDYEPISQEDLHTTAVFRIDIQRWSGKEHLAASDAPGAFTFGDFPEASSASK